MFFLCNPPFELFALIKIHININLKIIYQYIYYSINMGPPYAQNKKYIYKYRLTHAEQVKAINKKASLKHYAWKRIRIEFLNILIDHNN